MYKRCTKRHKIREEKKIYSDKARWSYPHIKGRKYKENEFIH